MERYSPSGTNSMFGRGTEHNRGIPLRDRENTVFQKMMQKCLHSTCFAPENLAPINESLAKLMQALRVNSSISFHTSTEQTCRPAGGIFKCPWHDASTDKYEKQPLAEHVLHTITAALQQNHELLLPDSARSSVGLHSGRGKAPNRLLGTIYRWGNGFSSTFQLSKLAGSLVSVAQ